MKLHELNYSVHRNEFVNKIFCWNCYVKINNIS